MEKLSPIISVMNLMDVSKYGSAISTDISNNWQLRSMLDYIEIEHFFDPTNGIYT